MQTSLQKILKYYVYPIATLSGSIIGVGFLALPYITLKVGIWPMLFYVIAITGLLVFLHVIFAKISLKTPDHKRWPGFVGYYLGSWAKALTIVIIILGSFGVLLAYIIIGGQFLQTMLGPLLGEAAALYTVVYFIAGAFIIHFGVKTISRVEFWALCALLIALAIVLVSTASHIKLGNIINIPMSTDWKMLFLPYGALLFSLWGSGLIPEVEEMLVGKKRLLKKVVIIATLIPAIIYTIFIFLVLGISGNQTTSSALVGLGDFVAYPLFLVAIFIGLISTFTAFITQGLFLKKTFVYDMGVGEFPAWVFTCFPPLILFFLGMDLFIPLISFVGGVFLSINGIFILLMYRKIGGKKIIAYPLVIIFILAAVYEIIYFVK